METTVVKADDHGRVLIRGARKGAKYLVTAARGGWLVGYPATQRQCSLPNQITLWGLGIARSQLAKIL